MAGGAFDFDFDWNPSKMPLFGQFFQNPDEEQMKRKMADAAMLLEAYRPMMADAQNQGLQQQMSLWRPANNAMAEMYGPGAAQDLGAATQQLGSNEMRTMGIAEPFQEAGKGQKRGSKIGGIAGLAVGGPFGALFGSGIGSTIGKRRDK